MVEAEVEQALTTPVPKARSRRRLLASGVTLLLPLSFAVGCSNTKAHDGSGDVSRATTTLDAAFVARAENVCAPYTKYNSSHFFTVAGFNRFSPDPAALPRSYLQRNPTYRTLGPDLEKLGRPATGEAAWQAVMDDVAASNTLMKHAVTSADERDAAAFMKYDERMTQNTVRLHADLRKLGLPGGSTCYGVQGDPLATKPRSD
jgi:hypothetical protein